MNLYQTHNTAFEREMKKHIKANIHPSLWPDALMHLGVLSHALIDAMFLTKGIAGGYKTKKGHVERIDRALIARRWIRSGGIDRVSELLGLDPEYVLRQMNKATDAAFQTFERKTDKELLAERAAITSDLSGLHWAA